MKTLTNLIENLDWKTICKKFKPNIVAKSVSFKAGLKIVRDMLFNEDQDDEIRDYGTDLLIGLHHEYPKEWIKDWKNDIFLGDACHLTMRYHERYEAFKHAYENAINPPPYLLLRLAGCYIAPEPSIKIEEAEKLVKMALDEEMSIEGAVLLRGIYSEKNDQLNWDHWDQVLQDLLKKNIHTVGVWPDFNS